MPGRRQPSIVGIVDERGQLMVAEFRNLARAAAWRVYNKSPGAADFDELTGIAFAGLVEACARYSAYCLERGFDPESTEYRAAFVLRRINGALLDAARSGDHLPRSSRTTLKMLADAEAMGLDGPAQARYARVTEQKADAVRAAGAASPVSLDPLGGDDDKLASVLPDEAADVESASVVSSVLAAAIGTMQAMDPRGAVALALRFYYGLAVPDIARVLATDEELARELLDEGVCVVHDSMMRAAT